MHSDAAEGTRIAETGSLFDSISRDWARFAKHFGLSTVELEVIDLMRRTPNPLTQGDVCSHLGYSKQVVNVAVKSLMKKGYVVLKEMGSSVVSVGEIPA